ncbi:putative unsaturated glucuronyl hydrolase [Sphaerochaeta pleomorpha str. Grapes]|uniref:Putative unsaturated glucuronyl hydrolase n=1 Tax=Sphaerochaeta pleomorpha (strain ATCC BAA-1885 / DSM 22778 / Grapes) TaxID=158190 RepID=G8QQC7_SPHPG|nr:glycoside hydrolase family 88 protein [Sphaerochaeta pleomorpha]AEV29772.1 putative unsaturated glucuronyl hydrolase [Sphaerochaeta pleomorpha str. Grapes]
MKFSEPLSLLMARSVVSRYHKGMMRWHYEHGLVILGCLLAGDLSGDKGMYDWAYGLYDPLIGENGEIATYRQGEYNLDQINAGRNLFTFYRRSGEKRFFLAAKTLKEQLDNQPRTLSGVYWHKEIYPWQIWLDGVYMQGPFYAQYCKEFNEPEGFDDIAGQILVVYNTLRDSESGLLYHAYDESRGQRWADKDTGLSPHFWGRAMGWFCMAVIDTLDYIPADHGDREALCGIVKTLIPAFLRMQDTSGMWFQVLDMGSMEGNYLETSCSSMFSYTLYKAVRVGIVTEPELRSRCLFQANKAMRCIEEKYLRQDSEGQLHLGGICSVAGLGGNPYRDGSFHYYIREKVVEDDFKGVGPFILACIEKEQVLP